MSAVAEHVMRFLKACPDSRARLYYHLLRNQCLSYEEICTLLDMSRQQASVLVRWLEKHGFVDVVRNKDDIRKFLVYIRITGYKDHQFSRKKYA